MFIELTLANDSNVLINIDSIASIQPYDEKEGEELMNDASVQEAISELGELFGQTISSKVKDIMELTKGTKSIITINTCAKDQETKNIYVKETYDKIKHMISSHNDIIDWEYKPGTIHSQG